MGNKRRINCPSCGRANTTDSNFCSKCGISLHREKYGKIHIRWILMSILILFLSNSAIYITAYFIQGPESFFNPDNLRLITYTAAPVVLSGAAFSTCYFSAVCTEIDMTAGALILAFTPTVMAFLVFTGDGPAGFDAMSDLVIPLTCGIIVYAGSWAAKKIRVKRDRALQEQSM